MIERAFWASASGMAAAAQQVDITAHNLANVNTPGFKAGRADFQDLVYAAVRVPVAPADAVQGVSVGHGTRLAATPRLWRQGPLRETGSSWDLALEGPGFFRVEEDGEILYTRAGSFQPSPRADGTLWVVDGAGRPLLLDSGQPVILPPGTRSMEVTPEGQIWAEGPGGQRVAVGQLGLALPASADTLEARGDGLFAATDPAGVVVVAPGEVGAGRVRQGMLEQSNTDLATEMVRLLSAQRAYQLNARALLTADEMLGQVNRLRP